MPARPQTSPVSPTPHRAARRARKVVYLYGTDYQWVIRLINTEWRIAKKARDRTPPGTTKYAAAVTTMLQCEQVLRRIKGGKVEWTDEDQK